MSQAITINGTGFTRESTVEVDGVEIASVFVNPTQLTATIPDSVMEVIGEHDVTVSNPTPGGGESDAFIFTVEYADPTISTLDPDEVEEDGGAITVTITGTGFAPASQAKFDGSDRTTNFISGTEIEIELLSGDVDDADTFDITVVNPTPGGGTSNAATFEVTAAAVAWAPSDIPNLSAWWDPSDTGTITTSSGRITAIADKTANNNDLPELTVAKGPKTGTIDGKTAMLFDTSGMGFETAIGSLTNINGPNLSVFAAVVIDFNVPTFAGIISISDGGWNNGWRIVNNSGGATLSASVNTYTTAPITLSNGDTGAGHPHLYGFTWEESTDTLTGYRNGVQVGQNTSYTGTVDWSSSVSVLRLGFPSGGTSLGGSGRDQYICEVVLVDGVISSTDREKLEGYLAHKWGFEDTLDSGHPYKAAPP